MALAVLTIGVAGFAVELHYFWARGCPDCVEMSAFLEELEEIYPQLEVHRHETRLDGDKWRLMVNLAEVYEVDGRFVPMVFVGDVGVSGAGGVAELQIQREVEACLEAGCPSPLERVEHVRWRPSPTEWLLAGAALLVTLLIILELGSS